MVQQCACDCKIENCMTNIIEMKIIFKMIEYREKNKQPSLMMAIVVHVKISINKMRRKKMFEQIPNCPIDFSNRKFK